MKRLLTVTLLTMLLVASVGTTAVSARPHAPIGTSPIFYTATFSVVAADQYATMTPPLITMRVLAFPPVGAYLLYTPAFSYKPTLSGTSPNVLVLDLSNGYSEMLHLRTTIQSDGTVVVPSQIVVGYTTNQDAFRGATSAVLYPLNP